MKRFSWIDIALWLLAAALLIPLVARFVESIARALEDAPLW